MTRPGRDRLLLLILLLTWAVGLRAWYATPNPTLLRFWDERYNVPNVHAALEEGSLKPVDYAYLRLTYLPQVAVLGAAQAVARWGDPGFSWFRGEKITPGALLLCRLIQCVFAGLSLLLTYLLGRRLFSPEVGLLAAFLVAASPFHLTLSVVFKPDIQLATAIVLAFLWSLRAIELPSPGRYVLAGVGIGLAICCKPTGGAVALPLTVAAFWRGWRDPRHRLGLVLAGATSLGLVLALNPYERYLHAFRFTRRFYKGAAVGRGTWDDPLALIRDLLYGAFVDNQGVIVGLAAAAGLVTVALGLRATARERPDLALGRLLAIVFPLVYLVLYGFQARVVLAQNVLPVLPFTSLGAAVLLLRAWRWALLRVPSLRVRRMAPLAATIFLLVTAQRAHAAAYKGILPRTADQAFALLLEPASRGGVWVRWEEAGTLPQLTYEPGPPKRVPRGIVLWPSSSLALVGEEALSRADAEVFPTARARSSDKEPYKRRLESATAEAVRTVAPRPFRSWGPALTVVRHPWRLVSEGVQRLERLPGYRFSAPEDRRQIDIYGGRLSVLLASDSCRHVRVPRGGVLRVGYGLNRFSLRRQGVRRFRARFSIWERSESGEETTLFRDVLNLRDRERKLVRRPLREAAVPLRRYSGRTVELCLQVTQLGKRPLEATNGFAFWEGVEVLASDGAPPADTFETRLAGSDERQLAALELRLPAGEAPQLSVDGWSLELLARPVVGDTAWVTERFPPAREGSKVALRLPPDVERETLEVRVRWWASGPGTGAAAAAALASPPPQRR